MKFEFLGTYGGSTIVHNLTGFFVDDFLAIDAGSLSHSLSLERQYQITDVLISHTHLDHTLSLPFLADNIYGMKDRPLQIRAAQHVIDALRTHIFNEVTWPDFSKLPSPERPTIRFSPFETGQTFAIRHLRITAIPVNHVVPSWAFFISSTRTRSCVLYTSDTCNTDRIWALANEREDLEAVIADCSFPNEMEELALVSGHMTPKLLARDLAKLKKNCQVLIYHIKPIHYKLILKELAGLNDPRLVVARENTVLEF